MRARCGDANDRRHKPLRERPCSLRLGKHLDECLGRKWLLLEQRRQAGKPPHAAASPSMTAPRGALRRVPGIVKNPHGADGRNR
jgi:hypothetical protein